MFRKNIFSPGTPLISSGSPKKSLLLFMAAQVYKPLSVFFLKDLIVKPSLPLGAFVFTLYLFLSALDFSSVPLTVSKYFAPLVFIWNQNVMTLRCVGSQ